jgi:hypothetical protein
VRHARLVVVAAWISVVVASASAPANAASAHPATMPTASWPAAYDDPPFGDRCDWRVFGEGQRPPWRLFLEDPLCVEYSKRDITLDNGGWLSHFQVGGVSVGVGDAVTALRPTFPELAATVSAYGRTAGETGFQTSFPRVSGC